MRLIIESYCESTDQLSASLPESRQMVNLPAVMVPAVIGEYADPHELIGQEFDLAMPGEQIA